MYSKAIVAGLHFTTIQKLMFAFKNHNHSFSLTLTK